MLSKANINFVLKNRLCTGCGTCVDICPTNSIQMRLKNGIYKPYLNKETCLSDKGCSKCLKVCPGFSLDLMRKSEAFYKSNAHSDSFVGYYESCYSGYSLEKEVRFHSASGGLLSQFLIFLLAKKYIDGAVVTGFKQDDKITPRVFIATTPEEILSARSSKYCPVSMDKIGNELKKQEGRFVIVGLPCHIQGFRKRADIDSAFRKKVIGYFAIYCSSNRSFLATEYLFKKYKVDQKDISHFAYRDEGCLGSMIVENKNGNYKKIPFLDYYPSIRSFFKPRRCLSCIDHYGALADVCFGDLHIKPYSDDKIGINSLIVRSSFFDNLLQQAKSEGLITLRKLDVNKLNESQRTMLYPKKRKVKALVNLDKLFGKETVEYDLDISENPSFKDYLSVIITEIQRFIGCHPNLWWLIDLSNIKRNRNVK